MAISPPSVYQFVGLAGQRLDVVQDDDQHPKAEEAEQHVREPNGTAPDLARGIGWRASDSAVREPALPEVELAG